MAINPFWMNAFGNNAATASGPMGVMAPEPTTGNGLFGANPEQRDMLLTLGMNLLAGSGYSPQKRSTGEILGSAMLAAQQSQAATRDRMMKQKLQEAQLAQLEREANQPVAVGQGTTLIDPNTREVVFQGEAQQPASVKEYEFARQNGYKGTFQDWSTIGASAATLPANVREWQFFSKLPKDQQEKYMEMKRASDITNIANVPTRVSPTGAQTPLSTLEAETDAARRVKEAEAAGAAVGKGSGEVAAGILKKGSDAKAVEGLLEGADALIDVATGSTAGALRDKTAAIFGYAPTSAQAIAELRVLQGNLMLQQPRMEGPQGVLDVKLYEQMAGQIGDPSVPAAQKKAALRTIRKLQEKYVERAERAAPSGGNKRIRVDAQGNVIGN